MANISRKRTRLRLKPANDNAAWVEDKRSGLAGVDILAVGDGHLACPHDECPFFHALMDTANRKLLVCCKDCGYEFRILLPPWIDWENTIEAGGELCCIKHEKDRQFVVIKQADLLSIGCRKCKTELRIDLSRPEDRFIYEQ